LSGLRPDSSVAKVKVVNKNPEYFELKGKTIDSVLKSPSNKNMKSTFDVTKLLSAINGKENNSRLYASILKTKAVPSAASPRQSHARQTAPIKFGFLI